MQLWSVFTQHQSNSIGFPTHYKHKKGMGIGFGGTQQMHNNYYGHCAINNKYSKIQGGKNLKSLTVDISGKNEQAYK